MFVVLILLTGFDLNAKSTTSKRDAMATTLKWQFFNACFYQHHESYFEWKCKCKCNNGKKKVHEKQVAKVLLD